MCVMDAITVPASSSIVIFRCNTVACEDDRHGPSQRHNEWSTLISSRAALAEEAASSIRYASGEFKLTSIPELAATRCVYSHPMFKQNL